MALACVAFGIATAGDLHAQPPYTIDVSVVGFGSVTKDPDQIDYADGTPVIVTAVPGTGYSFTSWSGDTTGTDNPFTVTLYANKSYTATFTINTYTLSYTAGAGGTISGTSPQFVDHGSNGTQVTAVPNANYHFVDWSDAVGTAVAHRDQRHRQPQRDREFRARYLLDQHQREPGGQRLGHQDPEQPSYNHGSSVDVQAVPNTGYAFTGWSGDTTGSTNPFTVILHENKTYTANFTPTYTLTTIVVGNGAVFKSPDQPNYNHGTSVQLTASAGLGYSFSAWSGDTTGTMNPFTKIMNGNKSYTATFTINTYTLSTSVVGSGSVNRNPSQATYNHGTSVQVTAVPGTGYSFTGWSGDTTGTMNPFDKIMNGNKSYTATFAINAYTLSTSVVGNGAVLKNPDQPTYNHGTSVQLTASAGLGYSFSAWSGDTTGTMNPFTKIMNGNKSYTATFTINTYTLSTSVVGNGAVIKTPDQPSYNHGTSVQLTASAGLGYSFSSWSGDTTGTMNPFTKIMNGNKSYTATFAINTYTLSTSVVGSGSVNRNPSQANYNHGTSVLVTAVPGSGYSFTGWSGDTTGTMNPFTKIMNGNKSYTATFAINTYTISTSVTPVSSGSVTKTPDQPSYNHGSSVDIEAVPGAAYTFSSWSGDTSGTDNPFTVILHENKSYTATFTLNTYVMFTSVSPVASGSVTKNPSQPTYNHGTSVIVTAVPNTGYSFGNWSGDTTGTMNPFTKIMNGNKSYTATFAINTYTLSTSVVGNGAVIKTPDQPTYNHGTSVQLNASAGLGYSFSAWSGDTTGHHEPVHQDHEREQELHRHLRDQHLHPVDLGGRDRLGEPEPRARPTYNHGTSVQLTAVPATGYSFSAGAGTPPAP